MAFPNLHQYRPLLRFPHWARVRPISVSVVVKANGTLINESATTISELSEQSALRFLQKTLTDLEMYSAGASGLYKGRYALMATATVAVLYARLYHYPTSVPQTASLGVSASQSYAGGFGTTANDDFAQVACETLNPWNAYSAAKAWEQAPWGGSSASEIVYPYDQTLPQLSVSLKY